MPTVSLSCLGDTVTSEAWANNFLQQSTYGFGSLEPEAHLTLKALERKGLFFHIALGVGAGHPLGF